ncbi:hypothetical protein FNF_03581 [Fusobacterium necrophorum subsp. funduliforme B35]|uniref:Uncharacterized protein n=1 Tax=Fusobacterium necrophorum subsp. funduliforme B35 TaxID=1226633 RepID=A0A017H530_9FUSO|nr:hypothetical protein FNF_03581 [Fusobacterium necrophorum subsp. funduliforme B35]KID48756.1 hypothetical protein C095_08445 [Fusobacterium necrophorum subsp. funduliforme B35]
MGVTVENRTKCQKTKKVQSGETQTHEEQATPRKPDGILTKKIRGKTFVTEIYFDKYKTLKRYTTYGILKLANEIWIIYTRAGIMCIPIMILNVVCKV